MKKFLLLTILTLILTACGDLGIVTAGPNPFNITPSLPPHINTSTPIIIYPTTSATLPPPPPLTASWTPSLTPTIALTSIPSDTPVIAPTNTFTPLPPPTITFTPLPLAITWAGCNTSIDITHSMGEVTNAYATVVNRTGLNLTNVCATLTATDEGRPHPDKTRCVPALPSGFQITWKLTVDTTSNVPSVLQAAVTSNEGLTASAPGQTCTDLGTNRPTDNVVGVVIAIP